MKIAAFTKTYGKKTVLRFPACELPQGRIVAVIGANGSGKSTLAKVLSGIEPADRRVKPLTGAAVGYLPQKGYGFRMSVRANLLLNGRDKALAARRMDALKIRDLEKARAHRLSGGETARMALARLLMKTYDLVILDEPTAAMDRESTLLAEKLVREYVQETGCALLLVTHSLQQARRMADEVLFLSGGALIERGPVQRVLYHPDQPLTRQFLEFYGFSPAPPQDP
jgi:ABC-type Mn2+/Zn2+ transport system ATPase subunit